jgi:hypothetical protein
MTSEPLPEPSVALHEPPTPAGTPTAVGLQRPSFRAVRRLSAATYQETLLISAVATVLGLRAYLQATGYPQVGGNGLHIAHVLWGGLLMLVGLVLLLSFVGNQARLLGALAGGIGFGLFVDELGKFLTSDNNYFFKPTVGMLYIIFVVLLIVFRALDARRPLRAPEAIANAADALPDLVIVGATPTARARALQPLITNGVGGPLANAIAAFVAAAPSIQDQSPSLPARVILWMRRAYERLIATRWFGRVIVIVFLVNAVVGVLIAALIAFALVVAAMMAGGYVVGADISLELSSQGWGIVGLDTFASALVLALTVIGAIRYPSDRLAGLRWFQRSVLVSLLLVDPLNFFAEEFGALGQLAVDLILWLGVSYLVAQEEARRLPARGRLGDD